MLNLLPLFIIYCWIVLMNAVVMALLWRSSHVEYYKDMMRLWLWGGYNFIIAGVTSEASNLVKVLQFSTYFFFYYNLAKLLLKTSGISFKLRTFVYLHLGSVALTLLLSQFESVSPLLLALPVSITTGLPSMVIGAIALKNHYKRLSIALTGLAITTFAEGLHTIDYAFFYTDMNLVMTGFTIGFALTVSLTLFGPGVIVEKVTRDKVELEMNLSYKAHLTEHAKLIALGEMAAGVAHEINNPLATIQFSLTHFQRLIDKGEVLTKDVLRKQYDTMTTEVRRISSIIKGLLELSHDEKRSPSQRFNIHVLVDRTLSFCREKFAFHGVQIRVGEFDKNLIVYGRTSQVSQILLNLLNNAFDAAKNSEEKWIEVSAHRVDDHVQLLIANSGSKIPAEIKSKIFQPFFSSKTESKNIGLGLSISKSLAQSHGGDIFLDDSLPQTTFVLELPILFERPL